MGGDRLTHTQPATPTHTPAPPQLPPPACPCPLPAAYAHAPPPHQATRLYYAHTHCAAPHHAHTCTLCHCPHHLHTLPTPYLPHPSPCLNRRAGRTRRLMGGRATRDASRAATCFLVVREGRALQPCWRRFSPLSPMRHLLFNGLPNTSPTTLPSATYFARRAAALIWHFTAYYALRCHAAEMTYGDRDRRAAT